jgi:DNA-binding IclR family transcriptional regulator
LLPSAELAGRLPNPLPRVTRKSVTSRARLLREIAAARASGYAFDEDGAILGLSCVATGFSSDHADGGHLAISITTPTDSLDDDRRTTIRATLDAVAGKLRSRL